MESELQRFRRQKQREQKTEEIKAKIKDTADSWTRTVVTALLPNWNDSEEEDGGDDEGPASRLRNDGNGHETTEGRQDVGRSTSRTPKWLMYLVIFLRFVAWALVYVGFVKIGFGAVYFTVSLLIFIYWNTRQGRRRRKGEVSAYSVFNRDCQAIDGTLKAEHLEKQLLYRSS